MSDSFVFDVPVELGLELMAAISADRVDTERELLNYVIDGVDGALLVVAAVDT